MLRSLRDKARAFNTTISSNPTSMNKNKHNSRKINNNAFSDYDPNDGSTVIVKPIYPDDTKFSTAIEASEVKDDVDDGLDDQPKALDDSAQSGLGRHLGLFSTTFLMCVPASPLFSAL
jgi:hypothetical protein